MAYWQKGTIIDGAPGGRVNVSESGSYDIRFLSPKFVLNDGADYGIIGYGIDCGTGVNDLTFAFAFDGAPFTFGSEPFTYGAP